MSYETFSKSQMLNKKSSNLKKIGFNFDGEVEQEYYRTQAMLFSLYHIRGESMLTLMKMFNIPSSKTMFTLFKHFCIESRTISEAGKNAVILDRNHPPSSNNYFTCYHTTWEGKRFFLRSSYELAYATILDESKTRYEVESMRLKYFDTQEDKFRIAIPDFFLPETNSIVEVKSEYFLDRQNMTDKFNAYKDLGFHPILMLEGRETTL